MNLYKLECLTEDGVIEENGYFFDKDKAVKRKNTLDNYRRNKKYGIIQNIIKIETEDEPIIHH